ncbi:hypothetical protein LSAT2_030831 [Lamellibrachia satsuma]|nr:hypothetical protein LSAT2_030831 [Lamellibrachia satsuma]
MTRWIGLSGPGHDLSRNSIGRYTFKATCFTRYPACVKLQSFGPFNNEHICFAGDSWKVDYIHLALTAGGLGWNETYKFNEWLNCNHKARC